MSFVGWLWIAFKLVSLTYQKQWKGEECKSGIVVNCFQISIFDISETIGQYERSNGISLWIAFKLVSLTYQKQSINSVNIKVISCELLSN